MGLKPARRYWLTGAGNGIGAALARQILETGAHLAVSSRAGQRLEELSAHYSGQILGVPGNLTDSQTVREISEQIAGHWGALDTVILNAGTAEYVDGYTMDKTSIEHIVRSNLLAASFCIEAALPLLRAGITPHLIGIASAVTYLPLSRAEAGGSGMRHLFGSASAELATDGIDVTVVNPSFDNTSVRLADCVAPSIQWSAETAAAHVLKHLIGRPREIALPALSMTELWPLPSSSDGSTGEPEPYALSDRPSIKGQP